MVFNNTKGYINEIEIETGLTLNNFVLDNDVPHSKNLLELEKLRNLFKKSFHMHGQCEI